MEEEQSSSSPFLNFFNAYKEQCHGLPISVRELLRFASRKWARLTPSEKECYADVIDPVFPEASTSQSSECEQIGEDSQMCIGSPYSRQRASERALLRSKRSKPKPKSSLKWNNDDASHSGTACGYIHFLRKFSRLNKRLPFEELLVMAARKWGELNEKQRQQFERPPFIIKKA
ncbi:protamine-like protein 99C [Drosophila rhopaloa]|uniref:Uncharacterized protein LOC108040212 n=1 Tax=Drosophila rhopaloa TaxID=1041015 RepID=A0A6P4E544_DRORH|nr:protamine-like protein 99C [Drosophila rhopaloa]